MSQQYQGVSVLFESSATGKSCWIAVPVIREGGGGRGLLQRCNFPPK